MKKLRKVVLRIVISLVLFIGFLYLFYGEDSRHLTRNYYYEREFGVYFREDDNGHGRISKFDEIGWNDKYLVTKRSSSYYLIEMDKDDIFLNENEIVIGPMTASQFEQYSLKEIEWKTIKKQYTTSKTLRQPPFQAQERST